MVFRIFVEKKKGLDNEARALKADLKTLLGITAIDNLRLVNRYDVENIDADLMKYCEKRVFAEPQLDDVSYELVCGENDIVFAVEYLPGQFDQRADSAAQCVQIVSQKERPLVRTAKVYVVSGKISDKELETVKRYLVNPVESRLASMETFDTLMIDYAIPTNVETLGGFLALDEQGLDAFVKKYALAMDDADIKFCQDYFKSENREPTITEIRMIDTYWSDHCRHTTFLTTIDNVEFENHPEAQSAWNDYIAARKTLKRSKPINLMDLATFATRQLKSEGKLQKLDESEEINACTVKIKVEVNGEKQDWLLLFKNETHNHPTEIEPFGGAATCIGGAIRDPLSGRAYVYGAMRVTGAGNPLKSLDETMPGKLPQRKIVTTAAAGYSSYGNQIGLATGEVDEIYHDGYTAKRMEIGAVIGATLASNVRRECPIEGDVVVLLGGKTGRDGCGGATGSSKSHTLESLEKCGAEVQKGNAPEERKLQRLFRNPNATLLVKRCNDFGAGGVSVAIGELADGLDIDLNKVPKKYDGLDGTELAISESQERMAVVVAKEDADKFVALANAENLEATIVATVKAEPRLTMWWNGKAIVDVSREFLNSNGAEKHSVACVVAPQRATERSVTDFESGMKDLAGDLNVCSKRGLSERFDSTIGAGTVMMPFGGKYQLTPSQAMVNKISLEHGETDDCSFMAWGYNPFIAEKSPYHGAYLAVVESVSKLVAAGASFDDVYLTFQEYFERLNKDEKRWGKPLAALLGAYRAQLDYSIAAIGGKDSMSGTFEHVDVPPTLVSFAVTTDKVGSVISPEFKGAGHNVIWLKPEYDVNGLPIPESEKALFAKVTSMMRFNKVLAAYTPTYGGVAEAVMKACFGNGLGFKYADGVKIEDIFAYRYGSFVLELNNGVECDGEVLGTTTSEKTILFGNKAVDVDELQKIWEDKLEPIFTCNDVKGQKGETLDKVNFFDGKRQHATISVAHPKVLVPVFPGTNCEYDTAKAWERAGAIPEIVVINNLTKDSIAESVEHFSKRIKQSQMIFVPGGFSGGDEPDGSGKFITAFFRNGAVKDAVHEMLKSRDGLMAGVCNGFQALVKLGLVPYGEIVDTKEDDVTLTYNIISRHQSRIARVRVASNLSPWFNAVKVGDVFSVPISHGEGRFLASAKWLEKLAQNGQIATQYVDLDGNPTSSVRFNPNGSAWAVEGITSADGRVLGKMGHAERIDDGLYANVEGNYDMQIFRSAVEYFK